MKKTISLSFILVLTLTLFTSGLILFGKTSKILATGCTVDNTGNQYCLLEPIPLGDGATFDKYDKSNPATDPGSYINLIIKIFISIIGALGVIMIVLGGVQYMTTDAVSKKESGKEMITNSVFGLILALASWLILQAINPNLNYININPPQGASVTTSSDDAPPAGASSAAPGTAVCSQSPTINSNGAPVTITQGAAWASGIGNDDANRTFLTNHGVAINAANCPNVGSTGCTSVAGYTQAQLVEIVALKTAVCGTTNPCNFQLTGGTECWLHATHGPGRGKADFSQTPEFNTFVTGSPAWPTSCQHFPKTFPGGQGSFLAEQTGCTSHTTAIHWHVDLQ